MIRLSVLCSIVAIVLLLGSGAEAAWAGADGAPLRTRGPLNVSRDNPRYFADADNRVVYLTGSHFWENFQDVTEPFDYAAYLDRLVALNHNFIRLWVSEAIRSSGGWLMYPLAQGNPVLPLPYLRTGPDTALDRGPRLDLSQFNPDYFERLRTRVIQAGQRGLYVSVMLFQGFSVVGQGAWKAHPFNAENNANGIDGDLDGDGEGKEVQRMPDDKVVKAQEAYVGHVLETLHDLDNVLYEIVNEAIPESVSWQYHFIRFIKQYEREHQLEAHPVGMTFFQGGEFGGGDNATLFDSQADWISPGGYTRYARNPPVADGRKVMILDTDHIHGIGGDRDFVWESFFRGYNPIYMDPLGVSHELTIGEPVLNEPAHDRARAALGETQRWATRLDLRRVTPQGELSSTGYCLAEQGIEYLLYVPSGVSSDQSAGSRTARPVTINLTGAEGRFTVEWVDLEAGTTLQADVVEGGGERLLTVPFSGDGLVHLYKTKQPLQAQP